MFLERVRVSRRLLGSLAIFSSLLLLLPAGCGVEKKQSPATVRTEIEASNRQFMDAFSRGDAARISTLYAEDGQLLPPGNVPVQGRAAIEQLWRGVLALPVKDFQLQTTEVIAHGEDACEVGKYTLVGNDGRELDSGKYIVIWKHGAGGWKLYRDMWNSNAPVVTAPPVAPPDSTP
jgi:uncharacterized protein (TIGR02246 family)